MQHPVSARYAVRSIRIGWWIGSPNRNQPGEELTMPDGSIWFHPYDGRPPVLVSNVKPLQEG